MAGRKWATEQPSNASAGARRRVAAGVCVAIVGLVVLQALPVLDHEGDLPIPGRASSLAGLFRSAEEVPAARPPIDLGDSSDTEGGTRDMMESPRDGDSGDSRTRSGGPSPSPDSQGNGPFEEPFDAFTLISEKEVGIARYATSGGSQRWLVADAAVQGGDAWGDGYYATTIAFGDVNGDGRNEIGVTRYAAENPRYFVLNGDGTVRFEGGETWGASAYATSIAFGDVDGDGKDEVGVARHADESSRYFLLNGDGSLRFEGGQTWGASAYATSIAFGDVDADGKDEVGVARYSYLGGSVRWFVLNGDGTIRFQGGEPWGDSFYATAIAFGDVDGDGEDEVGVARYASMNYRYFVIKDGGTVDFQGGETWGPSAYATSIAFGDIDGDRESEVGVARHATTAGDVRWLILNGNGSIRLQAGQAWGEGYYPTSIAFGDVDADGSDEIGVARYAAGGYRYFVLESDGSVRYEDGLTWGTSQYATSIAFGDLDGDGRAEVGVARHATAVGEVRWFALSGAEVMIQGGSHWGDGYYATSIAFGDVNGDGKDEIGVTRYAQENPRYFVLHGDGSVRFEGGQGWGADYYATSIAFGDVDADGRAEVGVARYAGENSRYFVLDDGGSVRFEGGESWGASAYATSIAFGDVDGDGKAEVGVARHATASGSVRWLVLNHDGSVRLQGGESWGEGYYATSIAFGDVDGDGEDEIGIARYATEGGAVRWFVLDDGGGVRFQGGEPWGNGFYATSIAFGDVDGDGMDEVGVARYATMNYRYFVLNGDGSAQFEGGETWSASAYATSIAFGDVDGDGMDEVGVARHTGENDRYFVLNGDGGVRFHGGDTWGASAYATSIAFGDVDGDSFRVRRTPEPAVPFTDELVPMMYLSLPPGQQGLSSLDASSTRVGTSDSSSRTASNSFFMSASFTFGVEVEAPLLGSTLFKVEAGITVSHKLTVEGFSTATKTEYLYRTASGGPNFEGMRDDLLIYQSTDYVAFQYVVVSHENPSLVGQKFVINVPQGPPRVNQIEVYRYNTLPSFAARPFVIERPNSHVAGGLPSYPSKAELDTALDLAFGYDYTPLGTSPIWAPLAGTVSSGVSISTQSGVSLKQESEVRAHASVTVGGVKFGGARSIGGSEAYSVSTGRTNEFGFVLGAVPDIPFVYRTGMYVYTSPQHGHVIVDFWADQLGSGYDRSGTRGGLSIPPDNSVDFRPSAAISLEITTAGPVVDAAITAIQLPTNPQEEVSQPDLGMFFLLEVTENLQDALDEATIYVYYSDSALPPGTDESKLRLYWYDEANDAWVELPGGVDTVNNVIWGIVTHFSTFAPFGNYVPTADAGFDQTVYEGSLVQFTALDEDGNGDGYGYPESHDKDGVILEYRWDFGDGSPRGSGPTVAHVFGDDGIYAVALLVTDDRGTSASDTAAVTVVNVEPTVTGTDVSGMEGGSVSVTVAILDPGFDVPSMGTGETFSATIDWGDGSGEMFVIVRFSGSPGVPTTATATGTHVYGDDGVFTAGVEACDDDGGCDTISLQAGIGNVAPSIGFTVIPTGPEADALVFAARALDPGSDDLTFTWTGDCAGWSPPTVYANDLGAFPDPDPSPERNARDVTDEQTVVCGDDGRLGWGLRVDDDDGGVTNVMGVFSVNNLPPSLLVPQPQVTVNEGVLVTLEATAEDPGTDDLRFTWTWEFGPIEAHAYYNDGVGTDPDPSPNGTFPFTATDRSSRRYGDDCSCAVGLLVEDDDGGSVAYGTTVTIGNVAPSVAIDEATQSDRHVAEGHLYPLDPIAFGGSTIDVGSDDVAFEWDFGDGTVLAGGTYLNDGVGPDPSPSPDGTYPFAARDRIEHSFALPGDYVVTLTVTDDDGGRGVASFPIHVASPLELKYESIERIRTLKHVALGREDWRFVRNLDDAERFVWTSLGHARPFRPAAIDAAPGPDVSVSRNSGDRADLLLGPSWKNDLGTYESLVVLWANGVVTTIDLPDDWPKEPLRFHDTMWVDAWQQDLAVESKRDKKTGLVTVKVHAHDASMDFSLSLDADTVADLFFTYKILPWWIDGAHVDPKYGKSVFLCERAAVDALIELEFQDDDDDGGRDGDDDDEEGDDEDGGRDHDEDDDEDDEEDDDREGRGCGVDGEGDNGEGDDDDEEGDDEDDEDEDESSGPRSVHCRLRTRLWTSEERGELDEACDLIANLLVKADEMLARIALVEARETPVKDPADRSKVERELGRAERSLSDANAEWDLPEYRAAIDDFAQTWRHAQRAVKWANGK